MDDFGLVKHLAAHQIPLTVCPLSNVKLKVFDKMEDHNILDLLDMGVLVSVNSDDPPYFGGYLNDNFFAMADALDLMPQGIPAVVNPFGRNRDGVLLMMLSLP